MKICPKCGYERQPNDDAFVSPKECPKCGVVYERVGHFGVSKEPYASIEKPQRTEAVNLRYAGFWIRAVASVIDGVLITFITMPVMVRLYGWDYYHSEYMIHGPTDFFVTWFLPAFATIAFWVFKSATPGKMAIGARIIDARTGAKPSVGQFVGRYFAYFVSAIVFCLGFMWAAFDERKQAWHDKLAGTLVVRRKKSDIVTFG